MSTATSRAVTPEALCELLAEQCADGRMLVAIAGPPGSGKSTLAEMVAARLDALLPGGAAVVPMDGFHYDDAVLDARGLRPRKGAPETFDVAGLRHALERLRRGEEVAVPLFDRALEIARAGARIVPDTVRCVVVEGNYLLLTASPWRDLAGLFDVTIMYRVPEDVLRARLVARWQAYGLSREAITAKVEGNDLPNARLVARGSAQAHYVVDALAGSSDAAS